MPLLKATDPMPERPVVIAYYGEPGVRKTSIAHTAEKPLLLDFDRGVARSYGRKDAIIVDNWDEVLQYEQQGLFKQYKTIIIDTAKACLDDFLMTFVIKLDFKNQKNKLQAYGAIGDEFKRFVNARREEGVDIIIIAHAKKDEDTKKQLPDVTGQSYNLILRVSDQVGFVSMKNNAATIAWNPTDITVGKNTANLPETAIPDKSNPALKTFMWDIIVQVKEAIVAQSEEQREAEEKSQRIQDEIAEAKTIADLGMIATTVTALPPYLQVQLAASLTNKALAIIPTIKEVELLNEVLTFFQTAPMRLTTPVHSTIKKAKEDNKWEYNEKEKKFFDPAPPKAKADPKNSKKDPLADAIPGESFTHETTPDGKPQEMNFS